MTFFFDLWYSILVINILSPDVGDDEVLHEVSGEAVAGTEATDCDLDSLQGPEARVCQIIENLRWFLRHDVILR